MSEALWVLTFAIGPFYESSIWLWSFGSYLNDAKKQNDLPLRNPQVRILLRISNKASGCLLEQIRFFISWLHSQLLFTISAGRWKFSSSFPFSFFPLFLLSLSSFICCTYLYVALSGPWSLT